MIKKFTIQGLKSITKLTINCASLNLFVGTNSSGKSTILQGLLLVSQNAPDTIHYELNGPIVKLGNFIEAYSNYCSKKTAKITIKIYDEKYYLECSFRDEKEKKSFWSKVLYTDEGKKDSKNLTNISYNNCFYYLSCHRIGVQDTYPKYYGVDTKFGINGQYVFNYLQNNKNNSIEKRLLKNKDNYSLISQINYWLNYIMDAQIMTEEILNTDQIKVQYSIGREQINRRPVNVGSGVSYVISILIVCLASKNNSTIVIENPEIHLHPSAQSKLVEFLYFISIHGRQIFIETHSDHIFNGIRSGIATNKIISKNVCINFVYSDNDGITHNSKIEIGQNGRIINPQKDLFDQFDKDLNRMLGI